jgi:hypothetical protein
LPVSRIEGLTGTGTVTSMEESLMLRTSACVFTMFTLSACSDYDLHRPDEPKFTPDPEETAEPEEPSLDPDIEVSPSPIDFGGLPKDCPAEPIEVTVTNVGLDPLTVSDIQLDGNGSSSFSHTWDGAEFILEYGESTSFEVNFTPAAWLDYELDLVFTSNDQVDPELAVPTMGTGAEDASHEQTFTQDYYDEVDVMWVVDNSCSMDEELQQVRDNFAAFVTEFSALELDYHLAVITTDMDNPSHSGRIQGSIITQDSADPEAEFLTYVDQGSSGSGSERGFDSTMAALTEPVISTDNAGFIREDAALAVIVVTDENDSGSTSTSNFVSWFTGLKADPAKVSFSAICGDRMTGCSSGDIWAGTMLQATGGDKYIDASEDTGGIFASICTENYDEALQHLSLTAAGMTVSFLLDYEPSTLSDIVVTVEGVAIANDSDNGWTYQADTNSVIFHGPAIPGPGETVYISYPVSDECN